jgi:hypothetical protein
MQVTSGNPFPALTSRHAASVRQHLGSVAPTNRSTVSHLTGIMHQAQTSAADNYIGASRALLVGFDRRALAPFC